MPDPLTDFFSQKDKSLTDQGSGEGGLNLQLLYINKLQKS